MKIVYFLLIIIFEKYASFETRDGRVRYIVSANVDIPWALDKSATIAFTVIHKLDLNLDASLKEPFGVADSHTVGLCGCISKGVDFQLGVDKTGFVPGEPFKFKVDLRNMSKQVVSELCVKIVQVIQLYAEGRSVRDRTDVQSTTYNRSIMPSSSDKWDGEMQVPPVCPSLKDICKVIQIAYYGVLAFKVGSNEVPSAVSIPLVIGSIPLKETRKKSSNASRPDLQRLDTSVSASVKDYEFSHQTNESLGHLPILD
jgi:hypothetical protein